MHTLRPQYQEYIGQIGQESVEDFYWNSKAKGWGFRSCSFIWFTLDWEDDQSFLWLPMSWVWIQADRTNYWKTGDLVAILKWFGAWWRSFYRWNTPSTSSSRRSPLQCYGRFYIDIMIGSGMLIVSNPSDLPFTLIGATTRAGMLSNPLRARFGTTGHMGTMKKWFGAEIVRANAAKFLNGYEAARLALRSRGTSRCQPSWAEFEIMWDWAMVLIDETILDQTLSMLGGSWRVWAIWSKNYQNMIRCRCGRMGPQVPCPQ